jgi:Ca2+/Na+ antiporter
VFSIFVATQQRRFDIALNEVSGSGCYVTMVVVGIIGFVSSAKLKRFAFLRDSSLYLVAALFVFYCTFDGKIDMLESVLMLAYYVAYVIFVVLSSRVQSWLSKRRSAADERTRAPLEAVSLLDAASDGASVGGASTAVRVASGVNTNARASSSSSSLRLGWAATRAGATPAVAGECDRESRVFALMLRSCECGHAGAAARRGTDETSEAIDARCRSALLGCRRGVLVSASHRRRGRVDDL